MLRLLKSYWFLIGMALMVLLAHYAPPAPGWLLKQGPNAAIVVIFIMSGMSVSMGHLQADAKQWKYHALIAGYVFGFVPAVLYFTSRLFDFGDLTIGIYLIGALPTTIASSIAFTTAAGGSAPTALISSMIGNLAGVVISPLLLSLMIGSRDVHGIASAFRTIKDLSFLALLPFIVGQIAGRFTDVLRVRYRKPASLFSQILVLFLMYCAFAKNLQKVLDQLSAMAYCFVYVAAMVVFFVSSAIAMVQFIKMPRDKAAAVLFCSTQKTLAFGLPLALAYFGADNPMTGVYVVPLIFYYLGQMVSSSFLLHWWLRTQSQPAAAKT